MRPILVIVPSPSIDLLAGIVNGFEPMRVQAFLAEPSVEGFDDRIISRLPAAAEIHSHVIGVCLEIHLRAGKLRSIVRCDPLRKAPVVFQTIHRCNDMLGAETEANLDP